MVDGSLAFLAFESSASVPVRCTEEPICYHDTPPRPPTLAGRGFTILAGEGRTLMSTERPLHPPAARDDLDHLLPEVYEELRAIARRQLAKRAGGTLNTTGLVHEAYLRLANRAGAHWNNRGHFLALSSLAMRHVLVDRAKARRALKRGGAVRPVTLEEELVPADDQAAVLLELHEAIDRLALVDPRLARVVDCRFFGGLNEEEIAEALGVTTRTVQRDWVKARLLLRMSLGE